MMAKGTPTPMPTFWDLLRPPFCDDSSDRSAVGAGGEPSEGELDFVDTAVCVLRDPVEAKYVDSVDAGGVDDFCDSSGT
jgi:hypothetical protein